MKDLLAKYGIEDEVTPENLEEVSQKLEAKILEVKHNDPEYYKGIDPAKLPQDLFQKKYEEAKIAEFNQTSKAVDKKFSLTADDKKLFTEDDKRNAANYVEKAWEIVSKRDNSKAELQKLQEANLEFQNQLESKTNEFETYKTTLDSQKNSELESFKTDMGVMSINQTFEEKINGKPNALAKTMIDRLRDKYSIVLENGMPELRNKENSALKIVVDRDGKKEILSLKEGIEAEYREMGLWKEAQDDGQKVKVVIDPSKGKDQLSEREKKQLADEKFLAGQ